MNETAFKQLCCLLMATSDTETVNNEMGRELNGGAHLSFWEAGTEAQQDQSCQSVLKGEEKREPTTPSRTSSQQWDVN